MLLRARLSVSCVVAATIVLTAAAHAQPQRVEPKRPVAGPNVVDVSIFYESLAPYGEWIQLPPWGWVWSPYDVDPDWRPYLLGRWVWTECGWTWISSEPFGWATYHYGRWTYHPYHGWVWVPGTRWGPAWVAWRRGGGWVGWAALPPEPSGGVRVGVGVRTDDFGIDIRVDVNSLKRFSWNFVEEARLCEPRLHPHIIRQSRNVNIVNVTQNVTNYTVVNQQIVNQAFGVEPIERRIGRPVTRYRVQEEQRTRGVIVSDSDRVIRFFRPRIGQDAPPDRTPDRIIGGRKIGPTGSPGEISVREKSERALLDRRLEAERRALEDRQKREAVRLSRSMKTEELKKWQQREREALEEQMSRERKLLERYQQRTRDGKVGPTGSEGRKYKIKG
ncbi:MAG: hypothetical protein L6R00_02195 [Phycisphaerae bacterium]|nr:hypothetical protein [Phycisphaerae bacterium]